MLPASFVVLDALPLTNTGKVDRNALPNAQIGVESEEDYLAPQTALEKVLAGIFSEVLSLQRVGANDSFFELGGHSLLATQVVSRVREAFQLELPLRKLFETPTVAGLAAAILGDDAERERVERTAELLLNLALSRTKKQIVYWRKDRSRQSGGTRGPCRKFGFFCCTENLKESAMSSTSKGAFELSAKKRALLEALLSEQGIDSPVAERIPRREDVGPAPLSFAQQRLWFFDQFEPGSPAYNLLSAVLLQGKLDTVALERAFSEVTQRHEVLRTTFNVREGELVQIIAPPKPLRLQVADITHLPEAERETLLQTLIHEQTQAPFDLKHGPLLRITLVRLKDNDHVLLLAMHHIVTDAWSIDVFIGEIVELYQGYAAGREVALSALRSSTLTSPRGSEGGYKATCSKSSLHIGENNSAGASRFLNCPLIVPVRHFKLITGPASPSRCHSPCRNRSDHFARRKA